MRERLFRFKQFAVAHEVSAMKVGTDGVTLGAVAPCGGRVLDVGCGCGLIGLMLAQRGASEVTMVEIDPGAAAEAAANAEASPWAARVSVVAGDFLAAALPAGAYDSIVSNPPFFATGQLAPDGRRAAARHSDASLPAAAFMHRAAGLLAPEGRVCVILPTDRVADWTFAARCAGLHPTELLELTTKPGAEPKRTVCTFGLLPTASAAPVRHLALNSDEYKLLTSPFYL